MVENSGKSWRCDRVPMIGGTTKKVQLQTPCNLHFFHVIHIAVSIVFSRSLYALLFHPSLVPLFRTKFFSRIE